MHLKMCFLFGKILFGTCAHELDNLVLVNADSSCMYLSQHDFIIILIKRPLSDLISCSGHIWRHKTVKRFKLVSMSVTVLQYHSVF